MDAVTHPSSSSQSPRPTKRACAGNARILKEEDYIPANTCIPTEVSKLDPPAMKRAPTRYVDFGAAENASGGFGQEGQDDKEEEIPRRVYRDEGDRITEEAKDGLLNDDEVNAQEKKTDSHLEARGRYKSRKSFEERIEELEAYKAKHGHVWVTWKHDKSLNGFCQNMRAARRGTKPGKVITENRIKALDELGFTWEDKLKSFEKRVEELKAFKEKHGHVRVTGKHDKSLHRFCADVKSARRGTKPGKVITEDRIKALDELGFAWKMNKSFEERIEEVKAFKEKHGHVRVTVKHDKSLANFCKDMRCARRGTKTGAVITEDRIKALDEVGFEWLGHQEIK